MGPIRGQTRPLPVAADIVPKTTQHVGAKLNASIHNRFDVEVVDSTTGEVRQRVQAENVICNGYWPYLFGGGGSNYIAELIYGSGNGTPAATDTALFHAVGIQYISMAQKQTDSNNYYIKGQIRLETSDANGVTITELGLCCSPNIVISSYTLCTHAMLMDMNGNPVSIAKTATDIINIYATVFIRLSNIPNGISFVDNTGEYFKFVAGFDGHSIYTKYVAAYDIAESEKYSAGVYTITGATSSSKAVVFTIPRISASNANFSGGIASVRIGDYYNSDKREFIKLMVPGAWYSGNNITGEAIGTGDGSTTTFATDFIHATKATVYVDGVAASGVTVTDASSVTNNIVFATAPASGAVITADYHTSVIAKDVNHVFDLTVTFNFGEYST